MSLTHSLNVRTVTSVRPTTHGFRQVQMCVCVLVLRLQPRIQKSGAVPTQGSGCVLTRRAGRPPFFRPQPNNDAFIVRALWLLSPSHASHLPSGDGDGDELLCINEPVQQTQASHRPARYSVVAPSGRHRAGLLRAVRRCFLFRCLRPLVLCRE